MFMSDFYMCCNFTKFETKFVIKSHKYFLDKLRLYLDVSAIKMYATETVWTD
jgi:hypothetical protein